MPKETICYDLSSQPVINCLESRREKISNIVYIPPHTLKTRFWAKLLFDPVTPFSQLYLIHRFDQPGIVSILLDSLGCLLACLLGDSNKDH